MEWIALYLVSSQSSTRSLLGIVNSLGYLKITTMAIAMALAMAIAMTMAMRIKVVGATCLAILKCSV
jgi:hypothetical protein